MKRYVLDPLLRFMFSARELCAPREGNRWLVCGGKAERLQDDREEIIHIRAGYVETRIADHWFSLFDFISVWFILKCDFIVLLHYFTVPFNK